MDPQEAADRQALQELRDRNELKSLRTAQATPQQPVPDQSSTGGAMMRGAATGGTFGLADEAYGLVGGFANPADMPSDPHKSTWENFQDRYAASRDYAREHDKQAAEEHPIAFRGAELAGTIASPVSKIFAPAKGASAMNVIGHGAAAGGLAGFGGSNADNPEDLAAATAGGAALGGALAGTGRLASNFLGKLTPDNLRQTGTRLLAKAAGASEGELEGQAGLLTATDEAGGPVVGIGSKASGISDAAAAKARYYGEQAPAPEAAPSWRPFGGNAEKLIGGGEVDAEESAAARAAAAANEAKALGYRKISQSAAKAAEDQGANTSDFALPGTGIMASAMSGHLSPTRLAALLAAGVAKKAVRERGASFAGRAALGAADAVEGLQGAANGISEDAGGLATLTKKLVMGSNDVAPVEVGTVTGAANQYLQTGQGAQAVTQQVMGQSPESASDIREKRLREIMTERMNNLRNQGYQSSMPQP